MVLRLFLVLPRQAIDKDCRQREADFVALSGDVEQLRRQQQPPQQQQQVRGSSLDAQYTALRDGYESLQTLLDHRLELCAEWAKFIALHTQVNAHVKALQQRLETTRDVTQSDIDALNRELEDLHVGVSEWDSKKELLEALMTDSQAVFKDRPSQRTMRFQSEIQNLLMLLNRTCNLLQAKQGKLDQITDLTQQFAEAQQKLQQTIDDTKSTLTTLKVTKHDLDGVKDYQKKVKDAEKELLSHAGQLEAFRDVGRQVTSLDASKTTHVQQGACI